MTDLITPVIVGSFGGLMIVVTLGFLLLRQRSESSRFERQDYFKTYRSPSGFSDRRARPFKDDPLAAQAARREMRALAGIVLAVTIASIVIAVVFEQVLEILLVLIFLPVIVRLVRARSDARRRARQDESHSF